jgi:hypothetical protein
MLAAKVTGTAMDTIEFLLIVAVFAVVLSWYLQNAEAKSDGLVGLLALADDPEIAKHGRRKSYRLKDRTARKPAAMRDSREAATHFVTYTQTNEDEQMRRRFRRQDEARYRVKDKAARFKQKPEKA